MAIAQSSTSFQYNCRLLQSGGRYVCKRFNRPSITVKSLSRSVVPDIKCLMVTMGYTCTCCSAAAMEQQHSAVTPFCNTEVAVHPPNFVCCGLGGKLVRSQHHQIVTKIWTTCQRPSVFLDKLLNTSVCQTGLYVRTMCLIASQDLQIRRS